MTKLNQIYRCNICGNITVVVHPGEGQLVCCGQPMELLKEKDEQEEGVEKHVPVVEKTDRGILVKVGSAPHPMEEKHFIEWIEVIKEGQVYRKFLKPSDKPEAIFPLQDASNLLVREYCNIHGLWKKTS